MQAASTSRAGPSTPIRAITSTLSARSAQSIPPASQVYEPLVKSVLRYRLLYNILLPTLLYSWILANIWSVWIQGGLARIGVWKALLNAVLPFTWIQSVAIWFLGVVPAIILRNRFLTVTPTAASSPSQMFRATLTKKSTPYAFVTHMISSLLLATVHILMTYAFETSNGSHQSLHVFVKSKKHPYYLNGRVIFLLSSQIVLASAYLLRILLLDRFAVRWIGLDTSSSTAQLQYFRLARLITTVVTMVLFTGLCSAVHLFLFGVARSFVLPLLYSLPFLPQLLRPITAHFLRGPWTMTLLLRHWPFICQTFCLGLTTTMCWELAESPLDAPVAVAQTTADPALTLVSGITSSDGYFKHFAYAELRQFAREDSPTASARRSALFADQKYNPGMWACLVREVLLTLGKDYQLLLRRGNPEVSSPPPAAPPKPSTPLPAPKISLIRAPILKSVPASPLRAALDTLASDGPLSTAVTTTAEAGASHIPELFRSVLHASPPAEKAVEAAKNSEARVVGLLEQTKMRWRQGIWAVLRRHSPQTALEVAELVIDWWSRDRVNRVAEMCLPNRQLDAVAASALCHLICASLTEDRYGVVQRDIPKIIEALMSFLIALEEYQAEINKLYVAPSPQDMHILSTKELAEKERLSIEVARAGEVLSEVSDALKEGIVDIARTFGDKLVAFKFPPRIAQKLQGFVDYA